MTRVNFSPFLTFYLTIKTPTTRVNFYFFSNKKNSDDESYFYFLSSYFHGQSFSGLKFSKVWLRLKKRKFTREDFNSWACTASVASWTAWATWWSYWPATSRPWHAADWALAREQLTTSKHKSFNLPRRTLVSLSIIYSVSTILGIYYTLNCKRHPDFQKRCLRYITGIQYNLYLIN